MEKEIRECVKKIIRENFSYNLKIENDFQEILEQENFNFVELGFDSIMMMMMFVLLEEEFNIIINDEDLILDFESLDNLVRFISEKINNNVI